MATKVDVELKNFFVFNPTSDCKEGEEHKKVLYYYPSSDDVNTQVNNVGLVEAIIKFTCNFKPNAPVNSLHTQKKRQLYFQPEENYWMVMTLNLPYLSKARNGTPCKEYADEEVHDSVYEAVLKQAYYMYRLFSGTYKSSEEKDDNSELLKIKLDHFYSAYLKTLKLSHCDILNVFSGIHFLPLDKQNFMNVQCFINAVECSYPMIEYTSFLFNDSLIWSGIEPNDMQIIYQYLVGTLLPANLEIELQGGSIPRNTSPFASLHYGRYLTGPTNLKNASTIGKVQQIYLHSSGSPCAYHFIVYKALSASICFFVNGSKELSLSFFKELDEFMGPKLTSIASCIGEYCSKNIIASSAEGNPRFIYFNKLNLAYKSTVHFDNRQSGNLACTKESIKLMADMNSEKKWLGHAGETIVKTMNDYWVVGKISNLREFYVALQQKNASLIDISDLKQWVLQFLENRLVLNEICQIEWVCNVLNELQPNDCISVTLEDEVKKICDTELKGIFFIPCN